MKNYITQLSLIVIAIVGISFLMSYAKPAAPKPTQYIVVRGDGNINQVEASLEKKVNEKLAEGWDLQGGVTAMHTQAMVK